MILKTVCCLILHEVFTKLEALLGNQVVDDKAESFIWAMPFFRYLCMLVLGTYLWLYRIVITRPSEAKASYHYEQKPAGLLLVVPAIMEVALFNGALLIAEKYRGLVSEGIAVFALLAILIATKTRWNSLNAFTVTLSLCCFVFSFYYWLRHIVLEFYVLSDLLLIVAFAVAFLPIFAGKVLVEEILVRDYKAMLNRIFLSLGIIGLLGTITVSAVSSIFLRSAFPDKDAVDVVAFYQRLVQDSPLLLSLISYGVVVTLRYLCYVELLRIIGSLQFIIITNVVQRCIEALTGSFSLLFFCGTSP